MAMMNDQLSLLGQLTAGVVHDLSNYLAVVELSLLSVKRRARGESHEDIAVAHEATEHAIQLTRCLLAYARGGTPPRAPVNIVSMIPRLLALFRRVVPAHVRVDVDLDAAAPTIDGVAAEIEQLVLNLLVNACDAMPTGGNLRIRVYASGSDVLLEVADTGRGIDHGHAPSGRAACPSTKPGRAGGRGLGLGIVRDVAERHSARLVVGAREGGGTRVVVVFPLAANAIAEPA